MSCVDIATPIIEVPEFQKFPSIFRLSRDVIVTEKLDGTNASVTVLPDGRVLAGSRTRWISVDEDNFGFSRWVKDHEEELRVGLGFGAHFGEWWGKGVQRGYGLDERRFSLFNVTRWHSDGDKYEGRPFCCGVVPILYHGPFDTARIDAVLENLAFHGSTAAPGFMKPEGIVVYHTVGNISFKKTLDKNDGHKSVGRTMHEQAIAGAV